MSYGHRVIALLILFLATGFGASGYLVVVSQQWASDDMKVGKGHSKFPPQVLTASPQGDRR
jgi:hypothetical protein